LERKTFCQQNTKFKASAGPSDAASNANAGSNQQLWNSLHIPTAVDEYIRMIHTGYDSDEPPGICHSRERGPNEVDVILQSDICSGGYGTFLAIGYITPVKMRLVPQQYGAELASEQGVDDGYYDVYREDCGVKIIIFSLATNNVMWMGACDPITTNSNFYNMQFNIRATKWDDGVMIVARLNQNSTIMTGLVSFHESSSDGLFKFKYYNLHPQ
jgi:hypothetical protein